MGNLPQETTRRMRRDFKQMTKGSNLDIEKDVLEKLSGDVMVAFYGVAGGGTALIGGINDMAEVARVLGLLGAVRFESPDALNTLVGKIAGPLAGLVTVRNLRFQGQEIEGIKVIEMAGPTQVGRLYIKGDLLGFATIALSEAAVYKYLENKRKERKLADVAELDLGKTFTTAPTFTGLYLNMTRAKSNLSSAAAFPMAAAALRELEEAALSFGADPSGGFAELTVQLTPKKPAAPAGDKQAPAPAKK
jgi:hypothetical protein